MNIFGHFSQFVLKVHTDNTDDTDLKSFKDFYYRRNKIREFCEICVTKPSPSGESEGA